MSLGRTVLLGIILIVFIAGAIIVSGDPQPYDQIGSHQNTTR